MEFQFGTNWARFSRYAGNVVGQTLGMESLLAFFLESSFLSLLVFGEKRLSRLGHFFAAGDRAGLQTALGWFAIGLPLALVYLAVVFRLHRGKAVAAATGEGY
jgi:hypothetical protein